MNKKEQRKLEKKILNKYLKGIPLKKDVINNTEVFKSSETAYKRDSKGTYKRITPKSSQMRKVAKKMNRENVLRETN